MKPSVFTLDAEILERETSSRAGLPHRSESFIVGMLGVLALGTGRPPSRLSTLRATILEASADTRFPTVDALPEEVVAAQLQALSDSRLVLVYQLFAPARRAILSDDDQLTPPPIDIQRRVRRALDESCPGLIGHGSHEIISGLALHGRLPRWRCRVKVDVFHADLYDGCDGGFLSAAAAAQPPQYFVFTLMQQRSPEYESADNAACWFVWSIQPERRGGGGGGDDDDRPPDSGPLPARELSLQPAAMLA